MKAGGRRRGGATLKWVLVALVVILVAAVGGIYWAYQNPLALHRWVTRSELGKTGLERLEVEAAGRTLVLWRGGSGPDLVLLHGAGDQAGAWSSVVPALAGGYTLHVLDLPGHGDSEPRRGPLPMQVIYGGLEAYLAGLGGRPILVGNSMGAWLAMVQAHRHPEAVERIVAVNGGALLNPPASHGLTLLPGDRAEARQLMAALRDPSSPPLPDFLLDDIIERAAAGAIGRMMQDVPSMLAYLLDGRLHELATPVDLVWGESDRLMSLGYAERMVGVLPRVRLTRIESCGHIPMNECPERFVDALRRVLAAGPPA